MVVFKSAINFKLVLGVTEAPFNYLGPVHVSKKTNKKTHLYFFKVAS